MHEHLEHAQRAKTFDKNDVDAGRKFVKAYVEHLTGRNPPQVQQILERELSERVSALLGEGVGRIRVETSIGRADLRLVEMAREEQSDLVVAGTQQRHALSRVAHSSISHGLLRDAPMSAACIPAARAETSGQQSAPIRRVLAASDLSGHGNRAIPYAYGTVCPGGIVRLLHVLEPSRLLATRSIEIVAKTDERLRAQVPAEAATRGIQTEVAVIEASDVARAIWQEAERFGAHLVCIGSHGLSGLAKAVLGSVKERPLGLPPLNTTLARRVMEQTRTLLPPPLIVYRIEGNGLASGEGLFPEVAAVVGEIAKAVAGELCRLIA